MTDNAPIITSLESIRTLKQQKYNPLRTLTPASLTRMLEAFEIGYLREGAMLFEIIADRDDTLKSVKPKREKEVSQLDKQVLALPGSGAAGEAQRAVLEDFWNNVRTVNAYDRNERGGFRRLVKQMMSAVSYKYACHHIVWRPTNGQLRATFEFVPLWLFENRTGTLRYLRDPFSQSGELLDPSEWMVTQGDGLMIACSIGYLAKRGAFNDWLIFSEKFSVPGVLGRTPAQKDSPEGLAMRAAVESFGHDWVGVLFGDDGTHEKPIEIIQAQGNPSGMPMPAVVERVDRKFAALYRGADLSTMSAGGGAGQGASLQGKEKDILLADDAETITETLAAVSRLVIEWHFGRGVEPLAMVQLVVPTDDDEKFYLDSVRALKDMGVRISKDAVLERLGIQEAAPDEPALGDPAAPAVPTESAANADDADDADDAPDAPEEEPAMAAMRAALSTDLQPLGKALAGALQAGDLPAMQAALRKISSRMPEFLDSPELTALLGSEFAAAYVGGEAEEVANSGNPSGAVKGWETRRHNGWQAKPRDRAAAVSALVDAALDGPADAPERVEFYGDVNALEASLLGLPPGYRRGISGQGVRHMMKSHGDPTTETARGQIAITRDDIKRIPEIVAKSQAAEHGGSKGRNVETIRYYFDDAAGGTTTVLDEVRTKRKRLIPVQLMKFQKSGHRLPPL